MNDGPRYASFSDYLRVISERRVLIVVTTLVFGAIALFVTARREYVYEAETILAFKDISGETIPLGALSGERQTPERRAAIGAQSVLALDVAERARKELKAKVPARALLDRVDSRPEARTNLVVVTAKWRTGERAAEVADAFAEATRDLGNANARRDLKRAADSLEDVLDEIPRTRATSRIRTARLDQIARYEELSRTVRPVEIVRRAEVPDTPVSPKPILSTVLGLLAGLIFGLLAAFMRDALDRRFGSAREITAELHLPLLGHVREDVLGRSVVGNGTKALEGHELEGFRVLRTNVEFLDVDRPPKTVLVTSALPEEGKSTVSAALATAYAGGGKRTLLVECDLRRPTLASRLGLAPTPGITDYLAGNADPSEIVQTIEFAPPAPASNGAEPAPQEKTLGVPLVCIAAGTETLHPAELLGSQRFAEFLEQVAAVYDTVILDSAPLLPVVDTLELLPRCDAVVMCVRASQTTRDQARAAKATLAHFPARPTGVVVTGVRAGEADAYGYYSYGQAYA